MTSTFAATRCTRLALAVITGESLALRRVKEPLQWVASLFQGEPGGIYLASPRLIRGVRKRERESRFGKKKEARRVQRECETLGDEGLLKWE